MTPSDIRRAYKELDEFALLACQSHNYGNRGNWFWSFRAGLNGARSRLTSLSEHFSLIYKWHPGLSLGGHERHVAIVLFSMDSALECCVYALNALGQATRPNGFRSIAEESSLRRISPNDVIGGAPMTGWAEVFPQFSSHCVRHRELVKLIMDNHDVTKHREAGFWGGTVRSDPPRGFYEALGLAEDPMRFQVVPMKEVLMPLRPKLPNEERSADLKDWVRLEAVVGDFDAFFKEALRLAAVDVVSTLGPLRQSASDA